MPQTREHFEICRLLRVPAGLVVITKSDLVDADTLDVVRLEIQDLVAGSFLDGAPVLAVSAKSGAGLPELRQALARLARTVRGRPQSGPPRMPIDRVFSIRGFGTVVTGTLIAGQIRADDELRIEPSGRTVKTRGVQVHGETRQVAAAGQRTAINLAGVEVAEVARGETLSAGEAVSVTRRADVRVELLPDVRPVRHGQRIRFHHGTRELQARVAVVAGSEIPPGSGGFARLHFDAPVPLVRGDRFILRTYSPPATIGGGTVLDPSPPRRGVRTAGAAARFERLAGADREAVMAMIQEAGLPGLPVTQLHGRAGVPWDAREAVMRELTGGNAVVAVGDRLVSAVRLSAVETRVLDLVKEHHARHSLEEGIPREELRGRLFSGAPPPVFEHVLAGLAARGHIVARDRVALRGHSLALSDEEARARDAMVALFESAALTPPDGADLVARVGARTDLVERIAGLLARQKVLVRVGDLLFHESALRRLKEDVRAMKARDGVDRIDVAMFKDRYQITRKHAIPLLEFLDRERITRRVGDARQIL